MLKYKIMRNGKFIDLRNNETLLSVLNLILKPFIVECKKVEIKRDFSGDRFLEQEL